MERIRDLKANELMTPEPYTVLESERLSNAIDLMHEHDVRQLPVVDEHGRLVGIVTDRDLRQALSAHLGTELETGQDVLETYALVGEVMTGGPITVLPDEGIEEIIDILLSTKVGGLPVVNMENTPVGMISYMDVLAAIQEIMT